MTTTIGIIGLGQIGASIGLSLKAGHGPERLLGHDRDGGVARTAEGLGAVDAITGVKDVVRDAEIVFLCLPLSEMRETLSRIGPALKDNAVVVDTAPIKSQLIQWTRDYLPQGRYHVGLVPTPNPSMLAGTDFGIKAAHAELFRRTIMMVVTSPSTPAAVEQLGMNIARLLGAKPMLTDLAESDGIMTTAHVLPQLTAAALIEACVGAGGWTEARKLAGRPFTSVTGGMAYYDDPTSLEAAALSNPERAAHGLDVLIASLRGLREDISKSDSNSVKERLTHSYRAREQWLDERNGAGWLSEGHEPVRLPGLGDQITQMFLGGRIAEASRLLGAKREGRK
ncbi:MAG: prephenate dehydrogenase/arogenate dehydrogenase family protein [Chloroflexota bacterium]